MTVLSVTASDVALLRPVGAALGEFKDDVDDIAEAALLNGFWPWPLKTKPRLKGGGS